MVAPEILPLTTILWSLYYTLSHYIIPQGPGQENWTSWTELKTLWKHDFYLTVHFGLVTCLLHKESLFWSYRLQDRCFEVCKLLLFLLYFNGAYFSAQRIASTYNKCTKVMGQRHPWALYTIPSLQFNCNMWPRTVRQAHSSPKSFLSPNNHSLL